MFVFLALALGLGFVILGIGSDQGTGLGDLFRNSGAATGNVSVSEARERVADNPRDAAAKLELATALQVEGETNQAIAVLNDYLVLRPKDENALRELASLYLTNANVKQREAQDAQIRAGFLTVGSTFATPLEVGEGQQIANDPILAAVSARANEEITTAYTAAQSAYSDATATYRRIVALNPRDPNVQIEFAQTAQQAGDATTAIGAYERFLELAPDDPTAPLVRERLQQLKAQQAATPSG